DTVGRGPLKFFDGKVVYAAKQDNRWTVIANETAGPEYDTIGEPDPIVSRNGRHFVYSAKKDGKWRVVVDGVEQAIYEGIVATTPIFSPDGEHVVYGGSKGGKCMIVIDGKEMVETDGLGRIGYSPDGTVLS